MSTQTEEEFSPGFKMRHDLDELQRKLNREPLGKIAHGGSLEQFKNAFGGATLYCVMQARPKIQAAYGEEDIIRAAQAQEKSNNLWSKALSSEGGTLEGDTLAAFLGQGGKQEPLEMTTAYIVFPSAGAALKAKKMFGELTQDEALPGSAMPFSESVPVSMSPGNNVLQRIDDTICIYFEVPPRFVAEVQKLNELERDRMQVKGEEPKDLVTVKNVPNFAAIESEVRGQAEARRQETAMAL